ncbi:MAG: LacI family DNA-binding transcriptional regulator [Bacteroidota bacterium]|nr:LacI family DNA-binding transcriptional regulator [Bacteroidota bacterium]MDP4215685.1 LacI family DNA-binding transcriptional regulator [Bacteroidota bacterium]MDP4247159.1 LacI family DNA-binding transcriptional regulator [Bacteroidota bacterium]MDP4255309.1 LacI family DNA-binding transcriptional regulator [Bacteroidota bacterium]MDP4260813.1 LacI family DNA-binding transcriptional regulator [Bacteroidota bacterium]
MNRKKEITIYDIADKLNISVATVSRGLKDSDAVSKRTRKRIFELAEKMGYRSNHFARNLRQQHTNTIGVIVHELNSTFITSVLAGIEKVTAEAGYDIFITHSSESVVKEAANAENLFHKRVDGLIASLSFTTESMDHFKPFADKGIPVIFFDRVEQDANNSVVIIDNYKSGYLATRHLIEQGCVRIAHVTSSLKRNVYSERYKGYKAALSDSELPFDERLVMVKDLSEKSGIDAAMQLLQLKPVPDGIFFSSDFVASVAMRTLKEQGVAIPDDIAIVGFNNDVVGTLVEPALTTINYPGIDMGEIAARNLINHLKGTSNIANTKCIIVRSELIIRKSSLKRRPQV